MKGRLSFRALQGSKNHKHRRDMKISIFIVCWELRAQRDFLYWHRGHHTWALRAELLSLGVRP